MEFVARAKLDTAAIRRQVLLSGFTVRQLAKKAGISMVTAYKAVHGDVVSIQTVRAIAGAFGVSPLEIVKE